MKVFIDAGHCGKGTDTGAIGKSGLCECDVTLAISKLVDEKLRNIGVETKLYRNSNIPYYGGSSKTDLNRRCYIANQWQANITVSIHCNAAPDQSAHGGETYCYKFGGQGEKLARLIQDQLIHAVGLTNRGVKEGNFALVRDTNMPAILIELAFISNLSEEKILSDTKWHDIFADAIVKGICEYFGIKASVPTLKVKEPTEQERVENLVNEMIKHRIIGDKGYWLDVLMGNESANHMFLRTVFSNSLDRIKGI